MIPAPVSRVSARVYKGTPQFALRVFSTNISTQRKTSTILREELSHYEVLVQAQDATIASLRAMLQSERLEHEEAIKASKIRHEQDMEIAKKEFERLQEVALMAVDTLAAMKACKVEHELKERQMEMAMSALQQRAIEMLAIVAENDLNTSPPVGSSSPPSYKELVNTDSEGQFMAVPHYSSANTNYRLQKSQSRSQKGSEKL